MTVMATMSQLCTMKKTGKPLSLMIRKEIKKQRLILKIIQSHMNTM